MTEHIHFDEDAAMAAVQKRIDEYRHLEKEPGGIGVQARLNNKVTPVFHLMVIRERNNGTEYEDIKSGVASICANAILSLSHSDDPVAHMIGAGEILERIVGFINAEIRKEATVIGRPVELEPMKSGRA